MGGHGTIAIRRIIPFIFGAFKYALYAVAGLMSLGFLYVVSNLAYVVIGETMIPGFNLADHVTKDQNCLVSPPPEGCPGNRPKKSN